MSNKEIEELSKDIASQMQEIEDYHDEDSDSEIEIDETETEDSESKDKVDVVAQVANSMKEEKELSQSALKKALDEQIIAINKAFAHIVVLHDNGQKDIKRMVDDNSQAIVTIAMSHDERVNEVNKLLDSSMTSLKDVTDIMVQQDKNIEVLKTQMMKLESEIMKSRKIDYQKITGMQLVSMVLLFTFFFAGMLFSGYTSGTMTDFTTGVVALGVFGATGIVLKFIYNSIFKKIND